MILSNFSDHFYISITTRIKIIFFMYGLIASAISLFTWVSDSKATDWNLFYQIGFPLAAVSCFYMFFKPRIGDGSLFLFPLFLISVIRLVDIWQNYFLDTITLSVATLESIGWSFLLISISYIDLLESRIYHRLVNYLEQEVD